MKHLIATSGGKKEKAFATTVPEHCNPALYCWGSVCTQQLSTAQSIFPTAPLPHFLDQSLILTLRQVLSQQYHKRVAWGWLRRTAELGYSACPYTCLHDSSSMSISTGICHSSPTQHAQSQKHRGGYRYLWKPCFQLPFHHLLWHTDTVPARLLQLLPLLPQSTLPQGRQESCLGSGRCRNRGAACEDGVCLVRTNSRHMGKRSSRAACLGTGKSLICRGVQVVKTAPVLTGAGPLRAGEMLHSGHKASSGYSNLCVLLLLIKNLTIFCWILQAEIRQACAGL